MQWGLVYIIDKFEINFSSPKYNEELQKLH